MQKGPEILNVGATQLRESALEVLEAWYLMLICVPSRITIVYDTAQIIKLMRIW